VLGLSSLDKSDLRKLLLSRWFLVPYVLTQSKASLATLKPMHHLGVRYRAV